VSSNKTEIMKITSRPFQLLVSLLKETKKTCTVVEQSCGGVIQASIMAQPGASAVFFGGTVAYNTRKAKPLLLNDDILHQSLTQNNPSTCSTAESYIQSKLEWTAATSVAFCKAMDTDYAIAEGGAVGPTFSHDDMKTGFAVVAVAGKGKDGKVSLLSQEIIRSHTANRQDNMRFFADEAATLATRTIMGETSSSGETINRVETEPEPARALILERATHLRTDAEALGELEGSANFIILQGNQVLVKSNPTSTGRQLASSKDIFGTAWRQDSCLWRGLVAGRQGIGYQCAHKY
jgi:nicotinamide mononucleotide (NMN) deamidase PncC